MSSGNKLISKYGVGRVSRRVPNSSSVGVVAKSRSDSRTKSRSGSRNKTNDSSAKCTLTAEQCTKIPTNQVIKKDNLNIETIYQEVDKRYNNNKLVEDYWKKRTNQPYKNILYDQEYNKQITKEEDLVISNIKNIQKINPDQIANYENTVKRHNDELNNIYSTNNEKEHFKQFQYNLKHKYRITGPVADDQMSLKRNRIMFYQKEQEKLDQNRQEREKLIDNVVQGGIFNADELKNFGGVCV